MIGAGLLLTVVAALPADFDAIDKWVAAELKDNLVPGAALAIVHEDRIVHARGFGAGVSKATPFVIGSLSKSFTAVVIMQLVEQGRIELDEPVTRYLPWFRVKDAAAFGLSARRLRTRLKLRPPQPQDSPSDKSGSTRGLAIHTSTEPARRYTSYRLAGPGP